MNIFEVILPFSHADYFVFAFWGLAFPEKV
jgi:hypothetical protein